MSINTPIPLYKLWSNQSDLRQTHNSEYLCIKFLIQCWMAITYTEEKILSKASSYTKPERV
jgi:hypothetical protein